MQGLLIVLLPIHSSNKYLLINYNALFFSIGKCLIIDRLFIIGDQVTSITLLSLDVLKPLEPSIVDLSGQMAKLKGVSEIEIELIEIDRKVENIKITVKGENIRFEDVYAAIEKSGATIHSIDKIITLSK